MAVLMDKALRSSGPAMVIIQARTGSTRLPGKVLMDIGGKPMLARVIERARAVPGVDGVIVATTSQAGDAPIVAIAEAEGVVAFRGSESDLVDRYYRVACHFGARVIVRITADCPLFDPALAAAVLARFRVGDVDYATNRFP